MEDRPEFFVARDRARRLGFRLEKVLQERRLAWRGETIGMSTVRDEADLDLAAIATDARQSVGAVLEGRIRDRERGFMEVPFAVAGTTVAIHLEEAAALEAERRGGRAAQDHAKKRIIEHLAAALMRLEAFQATYDLKQPLGEAVSVDLGHLLTAFGPPEGRPWTQPPPSARTDAAGLGDVLLAARAAMGPGAGPWQVSEPKQGPGVRLRLGEPTDTEGDPADVVPAFGRAVQVLRWLHPVETTVWIRHRPFGGDALAGLEIGLGDPKAASPDAAVAALSGQEVVLRPEAARAVRGLLEAPALRDGLPPPPARLVAILGVLKELDRDLEEKVVPRFGTHAVRRVARELPREATRKAPLKKRLLEALQAEAEGVDISRAPDLVDQLVTRGTLRRPGATELAPLLVLFGTAWAHAGARGELPLHRGTLEDEDVRELAQDLTTVGRIRQELESGREVGADEVTRLEAAAVAAMGRLARL